MPKQFINLIGALVVILVLVLGVVLGVVPLSSQTGQVHDEATSVRQSNDIYDAQVRQLKAVKKPELESRLAGLRDQIPATNLNDEIFELVVAAASATGAVITSVSAAERVPWTAPVAEGDTAPVEASAETPQEDAPVELETETPAAAPAVSPRASIPFAINVTIADVSLAVAFVDALRVAPRLVRIENVSILQEAANGDQAPAAQLVVTLRSLVLSGE